MLTGGFVWRGVPLNRLAAVFSGNAASRFGFPGKGKIETGADADLAVVDLERERVMGAGDLFHRHGQGPSVGLVLRGCVVRTLVRRSEAFGGGEAASGSVGRLVRPVD